MRATFDAVMQSARAAIIVPRLQADGGLAWAVVSGELGAFGWSPVEAFHRAKAAGLGDQEALAVMRTLAVRLDAVRPGVDRLMEGCACSAS
jgi:hypothetical protein